jgi:hypothetical protein
MSLKENARQHWQEHRPKMFRQLEESNQLERKLQEAVEDYSDEFAKATSERGLTEYEAREMLLPQYIYLPPESDQQNLGEMNPEPQEPPAMEAEPIPFMTMP